MRRSQIEVHAELEVLLAVLFSHTLAHDANLWVFAIVEEAVVEHEVDVIEELLAAQVLIRLQLLSDQAEVHRLLDDVKVVGDVQLLGIHCLVEDPSLIVLPQVGD